MLYSQWMGELRTAGKRQEARDAASKVARYMPGAQAQMNLGVMDYELGDKPAALRLERLCSATASLALVG